MTELVFKTTINIFSSDLVIFRVNLTKVLMICLKHRNDLLFSNENILTNQSSQYERRNLIDNNRVAGTISLKHLVR